MDLVGYALIIWVSWNFLGNSRKTAETVYLHIIERCFDLAFGKDS